LNSLEAEFFYSLFTFAIGCQLSFLPMAQLANYLCGRSGRCAFQAQLSGNRSLDNGTLEEARIVARVQHGGIGERELAKIVFDDEALLNHLKRFGYDIRKVRDIKVREVAMCNWP
jgi:hypothetical protein